MTLAVLRCSRCQEPLDERVGYACDIYGKPVCQDCHRLEWGFDEKPEPAA